MNQRLTAIIVVIIVLSFGMVIGYSTGPPDGRSGAPGDSNCSVACHSSFAVNSGPGTLSITSANTYSPSQGVPIAIGLAQTGQIRWGFEAVMLDTNNNQIGTFSLDEPTRTQISDDIINGREYVKHTALGTDSGTADVAPGWTFTWNAPSTNAGPVTLYVAGNAANGNGTNLGDYIYTTSKTILPATSGCCVGIRGNVDNDSNDQIDIADLVYFVTYSFGGGPAPVCTDEADIDGSGALDIADIVYLVTYMFGGGPAPVSCP